MKLENEVQFKLGVKLKDKITGHEGIAVGVLIYINGCIQFGLKGQLDKDGKMPETHWIDQSQLEQTGEGIFVEPKQIGCDRDLGPANPCY